MHTGTPDDWYGEMTATLGDRLTAAREAKGLSVDEFARVLGVRDRTVRNWEADASEPRGNRLQMIGGALGVSLRWLMTGEGQGGVDRTVASARRSLLTDVRLLRAEMERMALRVASIERALAQEEAAAA